MNRAHRGARLGVIVCTVMVLAACDEPRGPAGPDGPGAAVTVQIREIRATVSECCVPGPYTYRAPVIVRETRGVGATITGVTITLTRASGEPIVNQVSASDLFGTARLSAGGMLTSVVAATGPLASVQQIAVRVTFADDTRRAETVEASAGLTLDVTGTWNGPLSPVKTEPVADWSTGRVSLTQSGDRLTGQLISRDGVQFPLDGSVSTEWAPQVIVGGLPGTSTCAGVSLIFTEFEFVGGQVQGLSGMAIGRCFGTVAGTFQLRRGV